MGKGSIVVIGDAVIDRYRIIVEDRVGERTAVGDEENWQHNSKWRLATVYGGPFFLRDMIIRDGGQDSQDSQDKRRDNDRKYYQNIRLRSYAEIERVYRTRADEKKSRSEKVEKVWRVTKFGGYFEESTLDLKTSPVFPVPALVAGDCEASLLVIDDAGNGFRKDDRRWREVVGGINNDTVIVHKMFLPLKKSPLWEALAQTAQGSPSSCYVTVVNADDLRHEGLDVSRRRSWSRTYNDLRDLLASKILADRPRNPLAALLGYDMPARSADYLIVRFSCDAAACIDSTGAIAFVGVPGAAEGDFDNAHPGMMVGLMSSFVAKLASDLGRKPASELSWEDMKNLTQSALIACRRFAAGSFETDVAQDPKHISPKLAGDAEGAKGVVRLEFNPSTTEMHALGGLAKIFPTEWKYALDCLQKGEQELEILPHATFSKLFTVDPGEIEGFRSIGDLFLRHIENRKRTKPISVGVFGPPGAGKSFGIKQVADMIAGDTVPIIELNVAQFGNRSLALAMHRVRDAVLRGKRPLCLFDEFDTGDLKHLSHFLAPMQDGEFEDEGVIRPIGPAIFVFVGGVFAQYSDVEARIKSRDAIKQKLPDFISRLSGYVDIRGPNPELKSAPEETGASASQSNDTIDLASIKDGSFLLRRAILMRRLLEEHLPGVIDPDNKRLSMDQVVQNAFLGVPTYLHGARSMEAIIRMSGIDRSHTHFPISALPSRDQLQLHVDVRQFFKLMGEQKQS